MKPLLNLIFLFSLSTAAAGQLDTKIREEQEMGKAFHFENSEDRVLYALDFIFTGLVETELIKAKFVYVTKDLKTDLSDTLTFDIYCSWAADIVDVDSTGHEYHAKVCSAIRKDKEYIFEINESRSDYPSVNVTVFDTEKGETLTEMVLTRTEKH